MKKILTICLILMLLISPATAEIHSLDSLLGTKTALTMPDMERVMGCAPSDNWVDSFGIGGELYTGTVKGYVLPDECATNQACQAFHDEMLRLQYEPSDVGDDTYDAVLYNNSQGAYTLLFREKQAPQCVAVLTQDGSYQDVKTLAPAQPAEIAIYPIGDAFPEGGTLLGTLALVMAREDGSGIRGEAIRYHASQQFERSIAALQSGFITAMEASDMKLEEDSRNGLYYMYLISDELVVAALLLDQDHQTLTVIYNEMVTYQNLWQSDSYLPKAAASRGIAAGSYEADTTQAAISASQDLQPISTNEGATKEQSGVYLNGQPIQCIEIYTSATDDPLLGDVQLLSLVVSLSDYELHLLNVVLPSASFVSGARFELNQLLGTTTAPILQLESMTDDEHSVYLAGQYPQMLQSVDFQLLDVREGVSVRYSLSASYTLNDETYQITASGDVPWQALTTDTQDTQQSSDEGSGICGMCNGTGKCHLCHGKGEVYTYNSAVGWMQCTACYGAGDCPWCKGAGYGGLYAK